MKTLAIVFVSFLTVIGVCLMGSLASDYMTIGYGLHPMLALSAGAVLVGACIAAVSLLVGRK